MTNTRQNGDTSPRVQRATNTQELKRYSFDFDKGRNGGVSAGMFERTEGKYVRYDDLQAYIAQIKADAVLEAAISCRTAMTEGGRKWLCRFDDLLSHADKLQRDCDSASSSEGGEV